MIFEKTAREVYRLDELAPQAIEAFATAGSV